MQQIIYQKKKKLGNQKYPHSQCSQRIPHLAHALPPDLRAEAPPPSSVGCEVMRHRKNYAHSKYDLNHFPLDLQ